jgi:hypothetical protein
VPRVFGLFDRFRPPHALAAFRVASSFAVGFSSRGGRSRGLLPGERCQGFSPLQPRHRSFVRHGPAFADAAVTDSLRPSAGGADERGCASGARCHPAIRSGDPLVATPASQSLDPVILGAGLTLPGLGIPRAFHGFDFGLDRGPTCSPDTLTEGPARAFRPLPARSTLAARRTITAPVRIGGLPLRSTSRLVPPCGVSLVASAKMPRTRFYNRRSRHEHPSETPLPETARRAPWETRRRSTSRPPSARGFRLWASSGAGPPRGHPASDGCALDGAFAGFGPVDHLVSHGKRASKKRAPGLFRPEVPLSIRTL